LLRDAMLNQNKNSLQDIMIGIDILARTIHEMSNLSSKGVALAAPGEVDFARRDAVILTLSVAAPHFMPWL